MLEVTVIVWGIIVVRPENRKKERLKWEGFAHLQRNCTTYVLIEWCLPEKVRKYNPLCNRLYRVTTIYESNTLNS